MSRGCRTSNEYANMLRARYASTPKAVLAAVAVSLLIKDGGFGPQDNGPILDAFVREWAVLNLNGIVPQKPLILNSRQDPKQS